MKKNRKMDFRGMWDVVGGVYQNQCVCLRVYGTLICNESNEIVYMKRINKLSVH